MHRPVVSLIAAEPDELVPPGVALAQVDLDSFHTGEVRAWLEENRQRAVYVVAGTDLASEGTPALTVEVTPDEYSQVTAASPQ